MAQNYRSDYVGKKKKYQGSLALENIEDETGPPALMQNTIFQKRNFCAFNEDSWKSL